METKLRNVLSVTKAATALGVSPETVRKLYKQRELEGYAVGRKILIFEDSLAVFQTTRSNQAMTRGYFPAPSDFPVQEKPRFSEIIQATKSRSSRRKPTWERHG